MAIQVLGGSHVEGLATPWATLANRPSVASSRSTSDASAPLRASRARTCAARMGCTAVAASRSASAIAGRAKVVALVAGEQLDVPHARCEQGVRPGHPLLGRAGGHSPPLPGRVGTERKARRGVSRATRRAVRLHLGFVVVDAVHEHRLGDELALEGVGEDPLSLLDRRAGGARRPAG